MLRILGYINYLLNFLRKNPKYTMIGTANFGDVLAHGPYKGTVIRVPSPPEHID